MSDPVENKYLVAADDALEGAGGAIRSFLSWLAPEPPTAAENVRNAQRQITRGTRAADRKIALAEKKRKHLVAELERLVASGAPQSVINSQAQLVRSQDIVRNRTIQAKVNLQNADLNIDKLGDTIANASSVRNLSAASSQLVEDFGGMQELRRTAMTYEREKLKAEQMDELATEVLYSAADIDDADDDPDRADGIESVADIVASARQKCATMKDLKMAVVAPFAPTTPPAAASSSIDEDLLQRLERLNKE